MANVYDTKSGDKEGDLRLWWIPQVPMEAFVVKVDSVDQASFLADALADYDAFQFEHNVKGDYCNTGGLSVFENGEWSDWFEPHSGLDFDDFRRLPADEKAEIIREAQEYALKP